MEIYYQHHPKELGAMNTATLRQNFLLENLIQIGQIQLKYTHYDRAILGGVCPVHEKLTLPNPENLKAAYFLERRELGIINVGGKGKITTDLASYSLDKLDTLYLGKGEQTVQFESIDTENPAKFFLMSSPAHQKYPTSFVKHSEAQAANLGSNENANQRTIFKYIHAEGIQSCQLVMGLTILHTGSVWNTMPPHTHDRRMEAYFYFDIPENQGVLHLVGQADETRHLWVRNHQTVISPPWSIHAGCGTTNYGFIWGMAGENQSFSDMDAVAMQALL
jgi:4-deoxy-L-threo-5-hexosulose-uronate ketol-isomerase